MIRLIKTTFYNEKLVKGKLAEFVLNCDRFSMGGKCAEFEEMFAKKQERKHAVFVSSGSMANLILLQSLMNMGQLEAGDKVVVSALTWATNVMPLIQLGLEPVVSDCEIETLNINSSSLEELVDKGVKALFLTNVLGFSSDIGKIEELCKSKGILFIEDNCESLGSRTEGKLLGNFGTASTFSTFVGHHLSTIEGGLICTNDDELYHMLRMVRAHGWDRDHSQELKAELRGKHSIEEFYARYTFYDLAYNGRPTEIQGFIGTTQIEYWDNIVGKREENFKKFHAAAKENSNIIPRKVEHMDIVSNFAMAVVFKDKETFVSYKEKFEDADVELRPIIAGDITQQPFFKQYVGTKYDCSNARFVSDCGFYFGNNPDMTDEEVETLCSLIRG